MEYHGRAFRIGKVSAGVAPRAADVFQDRVSRGFPDRRAVSSRDCRRVPLRASVLVSSLRTASAVAFSAGFLEIFSEEVASEKVAYALGGRGIAGGCHPTEPLGLCSPMGELAAKTFAGSCFGYLRRGFLS